MAANDIANNNIGVAYTGTYASGILLEPMFTSDDIMRNYTVYPNVKYKQNILMAEKLTDITALNSGCGDNTCTGSYTNDFDITQKVLEVQNVSVKEKQCWDEFKEEVIRESYKNGIGMPDLNGTELARVIMQRTQQGIQHDSVRNMWAGNLSLNAAASTCSFGSMGDGLWVSMSADGAFPTACLPELPATTTAAANLIAVGASITGTDAEALLTEVFDTAPAELAQTPANLKKMFVTPNIYNAWYGQLVTVGQAGAVDYSHSEAQTGVNYPRVHFRGIEIVPMYEWDTSFTALAGANHPALFTGLTDVKDFTQGCIYAAKSNLIIGTDVSSPDTQLKMFYDEVGDDMHIRAYFTMGFQYGWNSLVHGGMLSVGV